MKRGNIILVIAFVFAIALAFYISSPITGEITLEDSQINNNVNLLLDDGLMQVDCSGGNPPKECLIYISEETACDAEWSNTCHIWANDPKGNRRCWTLPYTALSTCCPKGEGNTGPGEIYKYSIYDKGAGCCIQNIPGEGREGEEEEDEGQLLQIPFNTDKDRNGIAETSCCSGEGPFIADENQDKQPEKVCCPDGEGGNEVRNVVDGGCSNCCECMVLHEANGQSDECKAAQALTLRCRQAYKKSPYDDRNYKDICDVAEDCRTNSDGTTDCQYSDSNDPSSNYQQCKRKGGPYEGTPTDCEDANYCQSKCGSKGYYCIDSVSCACKEDYKEVCKNIQLKPEAQCPVYATPGGSSNLDCPTGKRICTISPSGKCDGTNFYSCVPVGQECPT